MQGHMLYAAILAVLMSLLFSNDPQKESRVQLVLFFLIPLMYLLDVHLRDELQREYDCVQIKSDAIDLLVNRSSNSIRWYSFTGSAYYNELQKARDPDNVHLRKLEEAVHPEVQQIMYYVLPWLAVYIFATRRFRTNGNVTGLQDP